MKKASILYVDDEMLFVRTVKRILHYDKLSKVIDITAAYHRLDAIDQINRKIDGSDCFNAIIVDYRLEPDRSSADEDNGEKLVNELQNGILKSKDCLFYLLSATDKKDDGKVFRRVLDKSSDTLDQQLCEIFKEVYDKIKYPPKSDTYTDEGCQFKGNEKDKKSLRYHIDKQLQEGASLLLSGTYSDIANLMKDIKNRKHIKCDDDKECIRLDLTEVDINGIRPNIEFELQKIKEKDVQGLCYVVCFKDFSLLNDDEQRKIIKWAKNTQIKVVLAYSSGDSIQKFISTELIFEGTDNTPKLYKVKI